MTENYLWTPWRMQYIDKAGSDKTAAQERTPTKEPMQNNTPPEKQEKSAPQQGETDCVFCDRLSAPPEHDRQNLVLYRGQHNFIILNLYPYNTGHLMIVPYEHTADYAGLDPETTAEMTMFLQWMLRVLQAEYRPQGFNMGMNMGRVAGAGVADHVHMHVVPRWAGDSNFMPIVGDTKVMPELIETTYDRLKGRMQSVK